MRLWCPDPVSTETLLRYIYASQKYTHIYMLNISTEKNQSTKVRSVLYIPTYEYNYKVITGCDTILQEYCITDKRKCENIKRCTIMNNTKDAHKLQKKSRETSRGLGKIGPLVNCWPTMLSLHNSDHQEVHYSPSSGIGTCRSRVVRSNPTSGEMSAKWCTGTSKHVSINLNHKHALKIISLAHAYMSR